MIKIQIKGRARKDDIKGWDGKGKYKVQVRKGRYQG